MLNGNHSWRKLCSLLDFNESNKIDSTPGGIPFLFLIAIVPFLLALMLVVGYFVLLH